MTTLDTTLSLGQRLLALREAQKLSLRTLAEKVGLSASFLSQVERDETSPSIASLEKIAHALGVDLASLFEQRPAEPVTRRSERQVLESGWSKARLESLSQVGGSLRPRLLTLESGGASGFLPSQTETFLLILKGALRVRVAEEEYTLAEGDAMHALPEHQLVELRNLEAEAATILIVGLGSR